MPRAPTPPKGKLWTLTGYPKEEDGVLLAFLLPTELPPNTVFFAGQAERGEEDGRYHAQVMILFDRDVRATQVNPLVAGLIGCKPNIHSTKKPLSALKSEIFRTYCEKEDTRVTDIIDGLGPWSFKLGELPPIEAGQGQRTDLLDVHAAIEAGTSTLELMRQFPVSCARHYQHVQRYRQAYFQSLVVVRPFVRGPVGGWVDRLATKLEGDPDHRKVHCLWSDRGDIGKSEFRKTFERGVNNPCVEGADASNIFHYLSKVIHETKIVYFDFPRFMREPWPFGVMEALKNQSFYSGKYDSGVCNFNPVHVVVFSNYPPVQNDTLSLDRFDVECLDP